MKARWKMIFKSIWYDLVSDETKVSNKSFHGQISSSVAEERLRLVNVDRCYLSRESDVVPGKYVLSCLVKGAVLHYSVPRAAYKKLVYSNFKFAECQFPVDRPDSDEKPAVITYPKRSCYVCAVQLKDSKDKQSHMQHHRLCECTFCNKFIKYQSFYMVHIKTCSPEKQYIDCQLCDYKTIRSDVMKRHMKMHDRKPLICKLCGKYFPNEDILQRHKSFLCGTDKAYCNICEKTVSSKNWNRHTKAVHNDRNMKKEKKEIERPELAILACPTPECNFKTLGRWRLLRHEKSKKHKEKNPKSSKCDGCDYTHKYASRLKKHKETCKKRSEEVIMFM